MVLENGDGQQGAVGSIVCSLMLRFCATLSSGWAQDRKLEVTSEGKR